MTNQNAEHKPQNDRNGPAAFVYEEGKWVLLESTEQPDQEQDSTGFNLKVDRTPIVNQTVQIAKTAGQVLTLAVRKLWLPAAIAGMIYWTAVAIFWLAQQPIFWWTLGTLVGIAFAVIVLEDVWRVKRDKRKEREVRDKPTTTTNITNNGTINIFYKNRQQ